MLDVGSISARYGMHTALSDVSLQVARGEVVSVLGANGAGKSTLLKVIAGLMPCAAGGRVRLRDADIADLSPQVRVERGIALVPEGRGIFGELSVRDNLMLGAHPRRARDGEAGRLTRVLKLFPRLQERLKQAVRTMSGGEQQMVAIGRALMSNPEILLLDEPSLGLSPLMVHELFRALQQVREDNVAILLVEQNAIRALKLSDRGYLIEQGRIVGQGTAADLLQSESVRKAYLGG
ncbi:MAG TPA: ABC transporter ATP-binding protein [Burkholderiaceae bacterium]